ncbi:MAG: GAF domain-containing sensor histidine kinase [Myxococcales bacterium]
MPGPLKPEDKRYAQFRKLTEVSRSLTYARTVDEVLRLTVDRAAEILESDKAVLMLTNAEGSLSVRAAHGLPELATERFGEPLSDTIMTRLQGLLGVDAQHFLGVPLVVGGEVTGVLAVTLRGVPQGREEDEWLLSALADQAAVALEKSRLDETAEFRERLIGIVSHDLRNPISVVLLGATVLLRRADLDERTIRTVARMQSSAERAARMIRDLLDYTQARLGGGIRLDKKLTDVHAIVRGVVEEMVVVHAERDIDLHQDGDARCACDSDRVAQIVGNLLSNAITYSPPGTPIRVHTSGQGGQQGGQQGGEQDGHVVLTVHNLGAPIAPSHLKHIFEAMQRAAPQVNVAARSVGLGLYIVRHLVEAHGGTIDVASSAGEGTTFTVHLPAGKT